MKIYVMTAVTDSGNGNCEFLGVVVGKTLAEVKIRAKNKWHWYGNTDPLVCYYAGHPRVATQLMAL